MTIRKVKKNRNANQGLVCVTKSNVRFFKDSREAARVMGLKVPQIFHEMATRGKNSAGRYWYSREFYEQMKKKKKAK